jgi:[ribosomal protein S18]-alanine N-acetyltransferase
MTLPVSIRKAEKDDLNSLAEIAYRAWERSILPLLSEQAGQKQAEQRRLSHEVFESASRIIVAELDGVPVGWCSRARGKAYIPYLFVAPELQGQGIGTLLLRRMESILELLGAKAVHLETPADNVRAVRFYQRQGYRILAMRPDGRPGQNPFSSVRLEKALHPFVGAVPDED